MNPTTVPYPLVEAADRLARVRKELRVIACSLSNLGGPENMPKLIEEVLRTIR